MMMRTVAEWLTPVKTSGLAAYLIASVVCAATAVRASQKRLRRFAAALCIIDLGLLLDIAFNWRWKLYDSLKEDAMSHHWYYERSGPQIAALLFLSIVLLVAAVFLSHKFASVRGAPLAVCGSILSIACWLTEIVSLHATDAVLYRSVGPLMVISFVWLLACLMTAVGVLMAAGGSPVD